LTKITLTPWQRVFACFGLKQSEFARAIGKHRSKISRALKDRDGFINGRDQERIIKAATAVNIRLEPDCMTPVAQ